MKRAILTKEEQAYWLNQHVRTRVHAVLASRANIDQLRAAQPKGSVSFMEHDFIFHATWEGQHAAMRWLLEFIGVESREGREMVTICCFEGGVPLESRDQKYAELKDIWVACSKATSHPTTGKHPEIEEPILHKAAEFIVKHLAAIYARAGVTPLPIIEFVTAPEVPPSTTGK